MTGSSRSGSINSTRNSRARSVSRGRQTQSLDERLLTDGDGLGPPKKPPCCTPFDAAFAVLAISSMPLYCGPAAFALIMRGLAYLESEGIPEAIDGVFEEPGEVAAIVAYSTLTCVFMAYFHLFENIKTQTAATMQSFAEKGVCGGSWRLVLYLGLCVISLPTGGLALANALNGMLFGSFAFKGRPSATWVQALFAIPFVISVLGNAAWSYKKQAGIGGFVERAKLASTEKTCYDLRQPERRNRILVFAAVLLIGGICSPAFYEVYSQQGCSTIFPMMKKISDQGWQVGFRNYTDTQFTEVYDYMNEGGAAANATGVSAVDVICGANGVYYALRFICMVAMRVALPLAQQRKAGVMWKTVSAALLVIGVFLALGLPSLGQFLDAQDVNDPLFVYDLISFLVGATAANYSKVSQWRKPIENSIRCRPCGWKDEAAEAAPEPSLLDLFANRSPNAL